MSENFPDFPDEDDPTRFDPFAEPRAAEKNPVPQQYRQLIQVIAERLPHVPSYQIQQWVDENIKFFTDFEGKLIMKPVQIISFICAQIDYKYKSFTVQSFHESLIGKDLQGFIENLQLELQNKDNIIKKLQDELQKVQKAERPKLQTQCETTNKTGETTKATDLGDQTTQVQQKTVQKLPQILQNNYQNQVEEPKKQNIISPMSFVKRDRPGSREGRGEKK